MSDDHTTGPRDLAAEAGVDRDRAEAEVDRLSARPSTEWAVMVAQEELADKRANVLRWLAVACASLTILIAVIGLNLNGNTLRNSVSSQGDQIATLTESVDRLTDIGAGQRSTIARLERRLDEAEAVASCRSRVASNADVALIRALRAVIGNSLGRPPLTVDELLAIDELLAEAETARGTTNQTCDTGESS